MQVSISKKYGFGLLICCGLALSSNPVLAQDGYALNIKNAKELRAFFRYKPGHRPIVSGHRGGMIKGFPENSISTFINTLKYTPAFYEIDPRITKDSVVVLMHDATLERTTNGTGKVADYTYAELQQFRLKDPEGNVTDDKIPTLKEAIAWSKGKTILNLDKKDVPFAMITKILREAGNEVIMLTVHDAEQAKYYLKDNPNRMFSAFVKTKEAFDAYEAAGIPWSNMIAYIGSENKPENQKMFDLLHAKGVMVMISSAPTYDKLPDAAARAEQFRDTFKQGADILESDLPIEVAAAIADLIPASSAQDQYIRKK